MPNVDRDTALLLTQSRFHTKHYPRHAHDGYSISLVQEGVHRFVIEGEEMEATSGMVRIIHPYEAHETLTSTWRHINLSLERSTVEQIAQTLEIDSPVIFTPLIQDTALREKIEQLYTAYTDTYAQNTATLSYALITHLLQRHRFDASVLPTLSFTPPIAQAKSYIHTHAHEADINLELLAKQSQMSKYHFLRVFKQTLGRTPHQYLQNIRIDCVRKAIAQGTALSEAAHACGFYDQSHMIRVYKKFYGHTPREVLRKKEQ
jgi:AraC-like DNA-binding protein